jgi:ABC-type transporter Mla subunit MlaD
MLPPLPRPSAVVGLTRSALDQALGSAASLAAVPARAFAVLDGVEALLARINGVVDRIEGTLDRTDRVLDDADAAVREVAVISAAVTTAIDTVTGITAAAGVVVGEAERVSAAAAELLAAYEPTLRRGAPMAARFVEQLSHEEVTAAIRLIDELPKLKQHLTADVLPILATLDRVGPDLHDLLDVTRDLKLAVAGIPGLGMLRRRGERLAEEPAEN